MAAWYKIKIVGPDCSKVTAKAENASGEKRADSRAAVSYTHLDVYKRQVVLHNTGNYFVFAKCDLVKKYAIIYPYFT